MEGVGRLKTIIIYRTGESFLALGVSLRIGRSAGVLVNFFPRTTWAHTVLARTGASRIERNGRRPGLSLGGPRSMLAPFVFILGARVISIYFSLMNQVWLSRSVSPDETETGEVEITFVGGSRTVRALSFRYSSQLLLLPAQRCFSRGSS